MQLLSLTMLAALLLLAAASDVRSRRIPNMLVVYGMSLALCFHGLAPSGTELFPSSTSGLVPALAGGLTGLALFLPLYILRTLGAGDVKLLAMVGTWLGTQGVLYAAFWTLLAGGVLALGMAMATGVLRQVGRNMARLLGSMAMRAGSAGLLLQPKAQTTGRLPYAVAIAIGTTVELIRLLSV
ncbi:hypothetical protein HHL10_09925 [Azohydromonas sp. G-1-1-14]|uniref:Prepilin type IV endopeptidase peptidase domain-containing protein n=1 Tax=Azohydromonas caseinilytica TaxID=2728836 RepID=A0A848F5G1_9BURK|nr:hypothetical protein [Azohydromonas caseinilytica]